MRLSFDGKTYDPDTEEDELRAAIGVRTRRLLRNMTQGEDAKALASLMDGATMIAVKLGAVAALHHAYSQSVDHELVDVFAHTLNRLVGLNYVPPEKQLTQETSSEQEEAAAEQY